MIRTISFSLGLLVIIGSFVLANKLQKPQKLSPPPPPPKVLMIGDSLSVGGFGEAVREHLEHEFGRQNVAFFASCGSSPESWLENEPVFHTRCGYREKTPTTDIYRDYHNGKKAANDGHAEARDTDRAIQTDNRDCPVRHKLDGSNIVRRLHPPCPRAICWRGARRTAHED